MIARTDITTDRVDEPRGRADSTVEVMKILVNEQIDVALKESLVNDGPRDERDEA